MAATDMLRGRQTATRVATNKSGGAVAVGDLVVFDDGATDNAFTTNTTARLATKTIGVAMEAIASNAAGLVAVHGYVPKIVTSGAVTRGQYLYTHSVAKQATATSQRSRGAFGTVLNNATSPAALLWGQPDDTHEFDYATTTSDTSITATTEATANTIVTGNAVTYDGITPVIIEFDSPGYQAPNVSAASMSFWLYDGASSIGFIGACNNPGTIAATVAGMRTTGVMKVRITPSAGAHTYSIRASVTSGTGTVKAGAGGAGVVYPAFIRISKV